MARRHRGISGSRLLIFAYAYLRLNRWHRNYTFIVVAWLLGLVDPAWALFCSIRKLPPVSRDFPLQRPWPLAGLLILHLAYKRDDRAIMLIPIWILNSAWLFGSWLTVTGRLSNDIIQPALVGGLVLIVLLIAFTILQNAFSGGALAQGLVSDAERHALALAGSGDILWDWETNRDVIHAGPGLGETLGMPMRRSTARSRKCAISFTPMTGSGFSQPLNASWNTSAGEFRSRSGFAASTAIITGSA